MTFSRRYCFPALLCAVLLGVEGGSARGQVEPAGAIPRTKTASSDTDLAYTAYIAEQGNDIAACFGSDIRIESGVAADFNGVGSAASPLRRLVVAVDASGSMAGDAGGQTKMEAAKEAASDFLGGVAKNVEVGLVAFGHLGTNEPSGKKVSCSGVETIYDIGVADESRIRERLGRFKATGWTPLAAALERSGTMLQASGTAGEQVVYVVSDGKETCGGDPVAAARTLHKGSTLAVVNVIGFDLEAGDRAELRRVAEAGGGTLIEVTSAQELRDFGKRVRNTGELSRARVAAHGQAARNSTRTAGALSRLSTCVSGATTREKVGVTRFFRKNPASPDVVAGVQQRLDQRHARYAALVEQVQADAKANRDVANRTIESQLRDIERKYGKLPEAQK
jgi:Ca-activated chloride channel family protein